MGKNFIDFNQICDENGICICSYQSAPDFVSKIRPDPREYTDGLALKMPDGTPVILFNEDQSFYGRRFTIAHELAHILLGHLNRVSSNNESHIYQEMQANCLAAALTAHEILGEYVKEYTLVTEVMA